MGAMGASVVPSPPRRSWCARAVGVAVLVLALASPLFAAGLPFVEGFEPGNTIGWSAAQGLPPPAGGALFVASLTPQNGASTLGSGMATLLLASDSSQGSFR